MSMTLVLHLQSDVSNLSAARKYWLWLEWSLQDRQDGNTCDKHRILPLGLGLGLGLRLLNRVP